LKRAVLLLSLAVGASGLLSAHELSPTTLTIGIAGPPGRFTLANGNGETNCTTTISVSVVGDAVTVDPAFTQYTSPPDSEATFTVTPHKVGTATITVRWVAGTSSTCSGSGSPTVTVTVADIPAPPAAVQEKQVIEPVSMSNGAEVNSWLDLRLRGPLPIYFERYYSSALFNEGQVSSALGPNWMHNYDLKLTAGATSAGVVYYRGQTIRFLNNSGVWTQSSTDALAFQLLQSGTTYRLLDPGRKLVYTFDGATGHLQSIQDRNGNTQTLTYTNGLLSRVADGLGATLDFAYDANTKLIAVVDQSGRTLAFSYLAGNLAGFTDAAGKSATYRYSGVSLLTGVSLPRGNVPYTQTYDINGKVVSAQDAAANRYTFTYNTSAGQSTMTDPLGQLSSFTHNNRNLTQQTDPAGNITFYTYDANSRLTSTRQPGGLLTSWTYVIPGLIAATTYPDGTRSTFAYASSQLNGFTYYDLTTITYPDGATETFQYDTRGNVTSRTARSGQQWTASYNSLGQPLTMTAPNGGKIVFTYSQDGTSALASVQFPATSAFTIRSDKLKRMTARVRGDGVTATFTYDALDNLLTKTDETGAVTTYTYDANGNTATVTDPSGGTTRYTRSGTDEISTATDAAGRAVTFRYDALDRVSGLVFADNSSIQSTYDAAGNIVTTTDGEGKLWKQTFDTVGNVTSATNPLNAKASFTLDSLSRVTGVTTAGGKKIALTYDAMGRATSVTDPASNTTRLTYDKSGAPTAFTLPDGAAAQYTRDSMGRVTTVTDPNGKQWQFTYDDAGRIQSFTDPLGAASTYQRDEAGHIVKQTTPLGTLDLTVDAAGRPSRAKYSDGTTFDFTRDKNGRLLTATGLGLQYDASGFISASNSLKIDRDQLARVATVTLASGKAIQYTYDRRGLCTQVKDWNNGVTTLQYDDASRLVSIARPNNVTTTYTYDADGDIASVKEATTAATLSSIGITRDARGLISKADRTVPVTPTAAQLAAAQSLHSVNPASQLADFAYDANGRRTSDDTHTYTWNLANHLTGYRASDGSNSLFTYDATGLLATQTVGGVTRQFVWNHALYVPSVSIVRSATADLLYLVHTPAGQLLYSVDPAGKRRFYHYDEQGNTLFTTDDSAAIADKFAYTEYGAVLSPAAPDNLFLYGGRYGALYLGANLYSFRQRVYDAVSGAFLSPDAKSHFAPNLLSPYAYANANPLLFVDINGADPDPTASAPVSTTAPDIVSGVGTVVGTTAGELETAANTTETLINMVDFENEGLKGAQQALKGTKFVQKVKVIAKPLNALSKVGTAAQVVSIGINTYNLHQGIKQAESEDDSNRNGAYQTYQNTFRAIGELYAAGKITAIQRNNLKLQAQFNFDDALLNLDQALLDNLLYEGFSFFTNSMAQVPFVNDAAIAAGNQFYK
jgi:RHS repeat-associated protein